MSITLTNILALVGKLDDTPGDETPRERLRRFLKENVKEMGQIRDYIEECLRNSGDQYNRALQDLINYLGNFLKFDVTFGRYHGVQGQIGFDGLWKSPSPTGVFIVVEVKTTEAYAIKTATLVGYVDALISEKQIPDWDHTLGLYVIGRPESEIRQLENAILAEKRTHQLRIISAESLLSLAELLTEYDVSHEDILSILKPSGPTIDPVVELMVSLVSQLPVVETPIVEVPASEETVRKKGPQYWLTPVKGDKAQIAEEVIESLVGKEKIYAFGDRTPGRKHLQEGDYICFYATGKGVVAHAQVATSPEHKHHPKVRQPEKYPWVFSVKNVQLYLEEPIVIDASLRTQLDVFRNRDPNKAWAWFVQATRNIRQDDFQHLTRRKE